ncbi:MAG TPA: TIGR01458 family HAD-type hydrolase [Mariprofundaceae bacterium]|nr:TIGR01458 family HAD-type hydrolase [Mariprofundaceae bacterium]
MNSAAIKVLLLDLDGVLYIGDKTIPGAEEALDHLHRTGLKLAGVTNTTTRPKSAILDKLADMHLHFDEHMLFTPAALAVRRIGTKQAALFVRETLKEDFATIQENEQSPDFVVMGDIGSPGYDTPLLERIFGMVMQGSNLIALHKNRFWQKPDGLHLDLGPFVTAIEYATGREAEVMGKPSRRFFQDICSALSCEPHEALMIGDDIESDIGGGSKAGLRTALVQTGKYRQEFVRRSGIRPDILLSDISDLPDVLKQS